MNDWRKYDQLKINGEIYSRDDLLAKADEFTRRRDKACLVSNPQSESNANPQSESNANPQSESNANPQPESNANPQPEKDKACLVSTVEPYLLSFWAFVKEWLDWNLESVQQKTSGSTGTPKNILLKKQFMVNSAKKTIDFFALKEGQNALLCLSTDFVGGKMMVVRSFVAGMNLILTEPKSNPLKYFVLESDTIHFSAMVPSQLYATIDDPNFSKIKKLIIGGAPVKGDFIPKLKDVSCQIFATYGMTETVSHIALKQLNHNETPAYFEVLPNVHIDLDDRSCLRINAPEICDEIIQTNDIVRIIDDTKFEWLGRFDNVINSGGYKIQVESLEEKISQILECQIYLGSKKDDKFGEQLVLVLDENAQKIIKETNIINLLKQKLNKYQVPKSTLFCKSYPLSNNGKIRRKVLGGMIEVGLD